MSKAAIEVRVDDEIVPQVISYSAVEDSTPIDPSDTTGGYGQVTVQLDDRPEALTWGGRSLELRDGSEGVTVGTIRGRSGNGAAATIVADSRIAQLAVRRTAAPFNGTLGQALRYYLELCNVTGGIVVNSKLESIPVVLPGWRDFVYDQIKRLGTVYGFETSLVSANIVFRPVRTWTTIDYRDSEVSWTQDESNLAQFVRGYFYNNTWRENALAYPPGGWNNKVTVYSVDAGGTTEAELEINASLVSVQQPECVSSVDASYSASSVYTVSGNDGLPIPPAQWIAGGGSVSVEIGEDTKTLKLTIIGARDTEYAPYSIAMASGTSNEYSSLRVVGTGVFSDRQMLELPANTNVDLAPNEVGATVEIEAFATRDDLYHALLRTASRYATPRQTINVTTRGINRVGDSGSAAYPTIATVKKLYPGATIAELAALLGPKISDWNNSLYAAVRSEFVNQAFGNIAGSRRLYRDSWYRVRSATKDATKTVYQAERDNVISDVFYGGETIAQWNARWAGRRIADVNAAPLAGAPQRDGASRMEGRPLYTSGDSFGQIIAPATTSWPLELQRDYGMVLNNQNVSSSFDRDVAIRMISNPPMFGSDGFVDLNGGVNPANRFGNNANIRLTEKEALKLAILLACADARLEHTEATFTGTWGDYTNPALSGGTGRTSDVAGSTCTWLPPAGDYFAAAFTLRQGVPATGSTGTWTSAGSTLLAARTTAVPTTVLEGSSFSQSAQNFVPWTVAAPNLSGSQEVRVTAPGSAITTVDALWHIADAPPMVVVILPGYTNPAGAFYTPDATIDLYRSDRLAAVAEVKAAFPRLARRIVVVDPIAYGWNPLIHTIGDGLHPNNSGHALIALAVRLAVGQAISSSS